MFPYVEEHEVWGRKFRFNIDSQRAEDWYSLRGYVNRAGGDRALALRHMNEWNPFLRALVNSGDVVIDCGCNQGWVTAILAQAVGPSGHVVAIDGSAYCVEQCRHNMEFNGLTNVTVLQRVVAEYSGERISFHEAAERVVDAGPQVETISLDDLAHLNPAVVKLDVEGYELPVLRGAEKLLARGVRFEIEIHQYEEPGAANMTRWYGFDPHEILRLFDKYGYEIWRGAALLDRQGPLGGIICCTPRQLGRST